MLFIRVCGELGDLLLGAGVKPAVIPVIPTMEPIASVSPYWGGNKATKQ